MTDYKNFVQDESKIRPKRDVTIKEQYIAEFKRLWNTINKNTFYVIDNLDNASMDALINSIKTEIENLQIDEIRLQTICKELNANKIGQEDAIAAQIKNTVSHKSKMDYLQFVRDLSNNTKTPILFIVKIFNALSSDFKNNSC